MRASVTRLDHRRTAAAVQRVLRTATAGYSRRTTNDCPGGHGCECRRWNCDERDDFTYWGGLADPLGELEREL